MVTVVKASGQRELFNEQKVIHSIQRAGISLATQEKCLNHIKEKLHENIATSEIYRHITEYLDNSDNPYNRSRYSLKEAIMLLGPSGYPFEDYVAKILSYHSYKYELRQVLPGSCVMHEVDVIATKFNKKSMIEAKFHNNSGTRTEVQVALYTKSRFEDLKVRHNFHNAWIVTNTKATTDAIIYAQCVGMEVISWSYPDGRSLRDLIEAKKLHPITVLKSLSEHQTLKLLENHIVICKDILSNNNLLDILFLSKPEKQAILQEIKYVCNAADTEKLEIK